MNHLEERDWQRVHPVEIHHSVILTCILVAVSSIRFTSNVYEGKLSEGTENGWIGV